MGLWGGDVGKDGKDVGRRPAGLVTPLWRKAAAAVKAPCAPVFEILADDVDCIMDALPEAMYQ